MAEATTTKTFRFELVSPERVLISGDASMVTIPGEDGEFGVLAGHAPLLSSVRPGVVIVTAPTGEVTKIFVAGGFADVSNDVCAVLAEEAVNVKDLDRSAIEQQVRNLQDDLGLAKDDEVKSAVISRQIVVAQAKVQALAAA